MDFDYVVYSCKSDNTLGELHKGTAKDVIDVFVEKKDVTPSSATITSYPTTIEHSKPFSMSGPFVSGANGIKDISLWIHANATVKYASAVRDETTKTWVINNIKFVNKGDKLMRIITEDTAGNKSEVSVTIKATDPIVVTPPPPTPSGAPMLRALWLTYASDAGMTAAYQPATIAADHPRLRVAHGAANPEATAFAAFKKCFAGTSHWMLSVTTVDKVKSLSSWAKTNGFEYIEYNIEGGFDAGDTNTQIADAAKAAHAAGLKFWATPTKAILSNTWQTIASVSEGVHIQAQTLQDNPAAFSTFVRGWVAKLKAAKPNILVTVQTGTGEVQGTVLEVHQKCWDAVATGTTKVDGFSCWFGAGEEGLMGQLYQWYHAKYRGTTPPPSDRLINVALFRPYENTATRDATIAAYKSLTAEDAIGSYQAAQFADCKALADATGAKLYIGKGMISGYTAAKYPGTVAAMFDIEDPIIDPTIAIKMLTDAAADIRAKGLRFIPNLGAPLNNIESVVKKAAELGDSLVIQVMGKQGTPTIFKNFVTKTVGWARAVKPELCIYVGPSVGIRGTNDHLREPKYVASLVESVKPLIQGVHAYYSQPANVGPALLKDMPRLAEFMTLLYA